MGQSGDNGGRETPGGEVGADLICSACAEEIVGRVVVVSVTEDYVTEEAKEQPHLVAVGDITGGEVQYSFPMHPIHFDEFVQEIPKMDMDMLMMVLFTDVAQFKEHLLHGPLET